jgi:type III pantothenate kinase
MVKKPLSLDGIAVDIGNSDYKYALLSQDEQISVIRSKTPPRLARYRLPVIGVSVVPTKRTRVDRHISVCWVKHEDISIIAPPNVGIDRLVALYAAEAIYGANSVLVIDVGTFLTLSVLHQQEFVGGYIIPGPQTMMTSYGRGAQLPSNQLWFPNSIKGLPKETLEAMQAGTTETLTRGLESLIEQIKNSYPKMLVVGTGGGALSLLTPIDAVNVINPTLVLEGLGRLAKAKNLF